jgi:hypothetical protein
MCLTTAACMYFVMCTTQKPYLPADKHSETHGPVKVTVEGVVQAETRPGLVIRQLHITPAVKVTVIFLFTCINAKNWHGYQTAAELRYYRTQETATIWMEDFICIFLISQTNTNTNSIRNISL